jgi:hypothetical protein
MISHAQAESAHRMGLAGVAVRGHTCHAREGLGALGRLEPHRAPVLTPRTLKD